MTDVGRRRALNEDALFHDDSLGFYVVADGVGGHARGDIASRETVEQLEMWLRQNNARMNALSARYEGGDREARWDLRGLLESGVMRACYTVFGMAEQDPDKKGMSTTCTAMLIRGRHAFVAHVGDSRVYRLRGDSITQITEDHTLVNYQVKQGLMTTTQARHARNRNVITRAVGHRDYVQVDTMDVDLEPGDRLLLCTDGLHGYFHDHDEILELIGDDSLVACARGAISLANERGGKDNISIVIVEVVAD